MKWGNGEIFSEYDIVEHKRYERLCGKIDNIIDKNNPYLNYKEMDKEEKKWRKEQEAQIKR